MIPRLLQHHCLKFASEYPVLTITGPRQSGKTTLAKKCFPDKPYVNLEIPDQREMAIDDPRGFLNQFPQGAVLDEIQRCPKIPSYIQSIVDTSDQKGRFILTGSQQLEISQSVSQSLAGRTALVKLLPLSFEELRPTGLDWNLDQLLYQGFYPRLYQDKLDPTQYYRNYFETYIQRDLRQLSQIENLHVFEKFVRLLASRTGQLLNCSNLANDLGMSQPAIRHWVSLLEASYIIILLQPFYRNIGKRLIKTPKIYFTDTGLASYLLGIERVAHLASHPLRGHIFENFIIMEFMKTRFNQAKSANLFFYRDQSGHEVDLVLDNALELVPIEIKAAQTPNLELARQLRHFRGLFQKETTRSFVIYAGEDLLTNRQATFLPWKKTADLPAVFGQ